MVGLMIKDTNIIIRMEQSNRLVTKLNNKWYYLNAEGIMQTGWLQLNNKWYYLNAEGIMQTGWLQLDNREISQMLKVSCKLAGYN